MDVTWDTGLSFHLANRDALEGISEHAGRAASTSELRVSARPDLVGLHVGAVLREPHPFAHDRYFGARVSGRCTTC